MKLFVRPARRRGGGNDERILLQGKKSFVPRGDGADDANEFFPRGKIRGVVLGGANGVCRYSSAVRVKGVGPGGLLYDAVQTSNDDFPYGVGKLA